MQRFYAPSGKGLRNKVKTLYSWLTKRIRDLEEKHSHSGSKDQATDRTEFVMLDRLYEEIISDIDALFSSGLLPVANPAKTLTKREEVRANKKESSVEKRELQPLILKRYAASIAIKFAEKRGEESPSSEDISKAYAIATSALQKQGIFFPGTRELTALGSEKEKLQKEIILGDTENLRKFLVFQEALASSRKRRRA